MEKYIVYWIISYSTYFIGETSFNEYGIPKNRIYSERTTDTLGLSFDKLNEAANFFIEIKNAQSDYERHSNWIATSSGNGIDCYLNKFAAIDSIWLETPNPLQKQ